MHELVKPPNLLSLARIPLAALVWLAPGNLVWVLSLMAAAGLTDVLDGWLARRLAEPGTQPEGIGVWLDPLCDKLFVISALVAVWVATRPPPWLLPLIATRELVQAPLIAAYLLVPSLKGHQRYDFHAAIAGKATTVLQFTAVGAILLEHPWTLGLAIACSVVGLVSAGVYVARAVRQVRAEKRRITRPEAETPISSA